MAYYGRGYEMFALPTPVINPRNVSRQREVELSLELPRQQYRQVKMVGIPFDPRLCNDGKFDSLEHAMLFIGKHCRFHYQQFTRQLAKLYLPYCRVLNFAKGGFFVPHLKKGEFEAAFNTAWKALDAEGWTSDRN